MVQTDRRERSPDVRVGSSEPKVVHSALYKLDQSDLSTGFRAFVEQNKNQTAQDDEFNRREAAELNSYGVLVFGEINGSCSYYVLVAEAATLRFQTQLQELQHAADMFVSLFLPYVLIWCLYVNSFNK